MYVFWVVTDSVDVNLEARGMMRMFEKSIQSDATRSTYSRQVRDFLIRTCDNPLTLASVARGFKSQVTIQDILRMQPNYSQKRALDYLSAVKRWLSFASNCLFEPIVVVLSRDGVVERILRPMCPREPRGQGQHMRIIRQTVECGGHARFLIISDAALQVRACIRSLIALDTLS
jgi:hypothetical protein